MGNQLNQLSCAAPAQINPVEFYLSHRNDIKFDKSLGSTRFLKVARTRWRNGYYVVKVFVIQDQQLVVPIKKIEACLNIEKEVIYSADSDLSPNCLYYSQVQVTERAALLIRPYVYANLLDRLNIRPYLADAEKRWIAFQLLMALNQAHSKRIVHGDVKAENVLLTSFGWLLLADFAVHLKPGTLPINNPANFNFFFDTSRRRTCAIAPERFVGQTADSAEPQPPERDRDRERDVSLPLGASPASANVARRILVGSPQREVAASSTSLMNLSLNDTQGRGSSPNLSSNWNGGEADVTSAADLFSAGCVIAQLFADAPPFNYPQALEYRAGKYDLLRQSTLSKIDDTNIRHLVADLLSRNALDRRSAAQHLEAERGRAFPEYFYTFMHRYFMKVATRNPSADETVAKLRADFDKIITRLHVKNQSKYNMDLLPFLALLTSACRCCRTCAAKHAALDLLLAFATHLPAETVLDRIVPFELCFANDKNARVRAHCIRIVSATFESIKRRNEPLPLADKNMFLDLVFPAIEHLVQDRSTLVQIAFARCIAPLAESAVFLLDFARLAALQRYIDRHAGASADTESRQSITGAIHADETTNDDLSTLQATYEADVRALRQTVGSYVNALLSTAGYAVRVAFLNESVARLCRFLGAPRTTDLLLAHIITFLNDKRDWRMRCVFYKRLFEIVAYAGAHVADYVRSLLPQGLIDSDERVVYEATRTCARLSQLGVLDASLLRELLDDAVPLVLHPNSWIRHAAVAFCSAVAQRATVADRFVYILPRLQQFLAVKLVQFDDARLLERALLAPLSRAFFDQLMRLKYGELADFLKLLEAQRELETSQSPSPFAKERLAEAGRNVVVMEFHSKLRKQGLESLDEFKIVLMAHVLRRLYAARMTPAGGASAADESRDGLSLYVSTLADNGGIISHKDATRLLEADTSGLSSQAAGNKSPGPRIPIRRVNVKNTSPMQASIVSMQSGSTMLVDTPNDAPLIASVRSNKVQVQSQASAARGNDEWKTMFETQPTETLAPRSQPVAIPRRLDAETNASIGSSSLPLSPSRAQRRAFSPAKVSATQNTKDSKDTTSLNSNSASASGLQLVPPADSAAPVSASLNSTGSAQSAESCSCSSSSEGNSPKSQVQLTITNTATSCTQLRAAFIRTETLRRLSAAHEFHTLRRATDSPEHATLSYEWRPRGILCGHYAEHTGAVNRVAVCDLQPSTGSQFATCSDDCTIRLWQFGLRDFDLLPNRSSAIWRSSTAVRAVEFAGSDRELLIAYDAAGRIFRIATDRGSKQSQSQGERERGALLDAAATAGGVSSFPTDPLVDGRLVDLRTMHDTGRCCFVYATTNGYLVVHDLRSPRVAYRLYNPLKYGLPTCVDVHRSNLWMVLGTANGTCVLWDLRFRLAVQAYPDIVSSGSSSIMVSSTSQLSETQAQPPRRSAAHARVNCALIDAVGGEAPQLITATRTGCNEVCIWDLENAQRRRVLMSGSSSSAPTSGSAAVVADRAVHAMCVGYVQSASSRPPSHVLITGGSDQVLRFWDLNAPSVNSTVIASPGTRSATARSPQPVYRTSVADGTTETVCEILEPESVSVAAGATPQLDSLQPTVGHIDTISSVALLKPANYTHQCFVLSASRDGVVKIWK